jgi:hypothetical protein
MVTSEEVGVEMERVARDSWVVSLISLPFRCGEENSEVFTLEVYELACLLACLVHEVVRDLYLYLHVVYVCRYVYCNYIDMQRRLCKTRYGIVPRSTGTISLYPFPRQASNQVPVRYAARTHACMYVLPITLKTIIC